MARIAFTKEGLERKPFGEDRQRFLWLIVKATVEDHPALEYLRAMELIEKRLADSGYEGSPVDVAEYAEKRFQLDVEGIRAPWQPLRAT